MSLYHGIQDGDDTADLIIPSHETVEPTETTMTSQPYLSYSRFGEQSGDNPPNNWDNFPSHFAGFTPENLPPDNWETLPSNSTGFAQENPQNWPPQPPGFATGNFQNMVPQVPAYFPDNFKNFQTFRPEFVDPQLHSGIAEEPSGTEQDFRGQPLPGPILRSQPESPIESAGSSKSPSPMIGPNLPSVCQVHFSCPRQRPVLGRAFVGSVDAAVPLKK
ncbi:hypothetical protein MMC07_008105 [Pseudocyphellaria aurata]|nr:hypothetical protein [Pseudocyphellaria aurata]